MEQRESKFIMRHNYPKIIAWEESSHMKLTQVQMHNAVEETVDPTGPGGGIDKAIMTM